MRVKTHKIPTLHKKSHKRVPGCSARVCALDAMRVREAMRVCARALAAVCGFGRARACVRQICAYARLLVARARGGSLELVPHTHTHTRTDAHTLTHTNAHTHTRARAHTHTHTRAHVILCLCARARMRMLACLRACACVRAPPPLLPARSAAAAPRRASTGTRSACASPPRRGSTSASGACAPSPASSPEKRARPTRIRTSADETQSHRS
eukprot:685275-Pleurochrysis_carterae.AAC.2